MSDLVTMTEYDTHLQLAMDDGKANAMSFAMFDALNAGLDAADGRVVVITGRPGKFSAGFDLSIMAKGGDDTLALTRAGADMAARLKTFDTPVVIGATGHALAMGALLCLSADYRIGMLGDYKIGLNEVAIGMTLPWFGVELARARMASEHFNEAVTLASIYDAPGAVKVGYLDEAVEPETLEARLGEVAAGFAALNLKAHRHTKARLNTVFLERYAEALRRDFDEGEILNPR